MMHGKITINNNLPLVKLSALILPDKQVQCLYKNMLFIQGVEFSVALFATIFCARTISLNTRRAVKCWRLRLINVNFVFFKYCHFK